MWVIYLPGIYFLYSGNKYIFKAKYMKIFSDHPDDYWMDTTYTTASHSHFKGYFKYIRRNYIVYSI